MWSPGAAFRQVSDPVSDVQPFAASYIHQVLSVWVAALAVPSTCVAGTAVFLQGKLLLLRAASSTSFSCKAFFNSDKQLPNRSMIPVAPETEQGGADTALGWRDSLAVVGISCVIAGLSQAPATLLCPSLQSNCNGIWVMQLYVGEVK